MAENRVRRYLASSYFGRDGRFLGHTEPADFDDQTHEVEMTFDPSARRSVVGIETELMAEIRRIAKERQVSTQTLVNVWLRQRVDQMRGQPAAAH